ncbi:MAG: ABC-2 transporter permease, partial [Candidatus Cloacimonetes bacterium]|nr:ABC-2 transporter permease [Candidatus Cloacimonadota bacterium]
MNNMKALLTKDFQINKKTLLMPFWITAGFYLLMIIGVLIAYFRGDFQFSFSHFDGGPPVPAINYIANLTIAAFPGFLCMIFSIMIMQGALNEDLRRKCELFHRSQPVSIWERTGSKFLVGTIGNWLVFLVIVIFNFIVINTIFISLGQFTFNTAIIGLLQSVIVMLRYTILIGSVAFFFSSIFKDKAFFKGIAL